MDETLRAILEHLGVKMPGVGMPSVPEVSPVEQEMRDRQARAEQAKLPPVKRAVIGGLALLATRTQQQSKE